MPIQRFLVFLGLVGLCMAALTGLGAAESGPAAAPLTAAERIDALVEMFDPNTRVPIENTFQNPASELASEVQTGAWFSFLLFLPFLILPQVLLLVVIFKFRDRRDGRKPATFIHNHRLEIFWTAVPILVVIVVAIPMTQLVYRMDLPGEERAGEQALTVTVIGKQFQWKYEYPQYPGFTVGYFDQRQQPVVLQKDRLTTMQFTSEDVNHAWAVPAFGIKKDCFPHPRFNYAWFTPQRAGFFDGQCYELCGEDHGKMVLSAVVVEEERDFLDWVATQRHALDAREVVAALRATDGDADAASEEALTEAVADYFADDRSDERVLALQYWAGYSYNLAIGDQESVVHSSDDPDAVAEAEAAIERLRIAAADQRPALDELIRTALAAPPAPADDSGEQDTGAGQDADDATGPDTGPQEG